MSEVQAGRKLNVGGFSVNDKESSWLISNAAGVSTAPRAYKHVVGHDPIRNTVKFHA